MLSSVSRAGFLVAFPLVLGSAEAAEPYTTESLRPYLNNEVNALELNHLFLQSMLDMDATPFTVGTAMRAAPASYRRTDGAVTEAGLGKVLYTFSAGVGNPRTEGAFFLGGMVSSVRPSGYPNIWALSGRDQDLIRAAGTSAIAYGGVAIKGTVAQVAFHRTELGWDADGAGRFVAGGCHLEYGCEGREPRRFAPVDAAPERFLRVKNSFLINLENQHGYHTEVLLGPLDDVAVEGDLVSRQGLAAARAAGIPTDLLKEAIGRVGAGLNFYDKSVDYYGDRGALLSRAERLDEPDPEPTSSPMLELPLLGSNLGDAGVSVRVVPQILPTPTLRLVEAGISFEGALDAPVVPSAGAQAKVFKRGRGYQPSMDAYAGVLVPYGETDVARGFSVMASYSFNAPDSLTFVPIAGTSVLGLQLIVGNATALPPPVAILREPI